MVNILNEVCDSSDEVHVYSIFDWGYNVLPSLYTLVRCMPDCYFDREMRAARRPAISGLQNAEMSADPPSGRGFLNASTPK